MRNFNKEVGSATRLLKSQCVAFLLPLDFRLLVADQNLCGAQFPGEPSQGHPTRQGEEL